MREWTGLREHGNEGLEVGIKGRRGSKNRDVLKKSKGDESESRGRIFGSRGKGSGN